MIRRSTLARPLALGALLAAACTPDRALGPCPDDPSAAVSPAPAAGAPASRYDPLFDEAARAWGVDARLLAAIAWTETRNHMAAPDAHSAESDAHGQPPAWGLMALRGDRLVRAAALAGLDPETVRRVPRANVHAAAALLADEARAAGVAGGDPGAWRAALEQFSGIALPAGRAAWARAVLDHAGAQGALAGVTATTARATAHHDVAQDPCTGKPPVLPPVTPPGVATLWRASPNFNARAEGASGVVGMVIVHTCEGSYVGCWSWLTNAASGVSAHYVVSEDGSEISYLVQEPSRAWHIGARYDCSLNRARRCDLNDVQSNHFTIGVEHAGYASQPSFPDPQIDVSAQLVCAVTQRHAIPRDGQHIVAHGQLQPWNRTDPGPNWPWIRYLALVQRRCGEVVVDDDAGFNDASWARVSAPATWTASSATPGHYGGGYRWAPTSPDSDDALAFEFLVETPRSVTVEARWTAGENRSAAAAFAIRDGAGRTLATAHVDQRTHHDEWRPLATLELAAGWHRVELSRRGAPGSIVVADAVRVR